MLDYIIKVLLFQTLFLAVYDLFLKRETFFQWNRAYLIATSFIAYVIPLLRIEKIYDVLPQEYVVLLPEILLSPSAIIEESFNWSALLFSVLTYLFWIGVIITSLLFMRRLYEVIRLIYDNEKEEQPTYNLVKLEDNNAFSFFSYIFLGKAVSEENKQQIIAHELVHVQQKHSLDLLFFEVQKIVCWFNPFSYFFQRRISELHEFIADSKAIKELDKKDYFQNLLAQTFGTKKISFINPFLKFSFIKKRIVMLNKHKSKQSLKFKYLLMLPLLISMLLYSSCEKQDEVIIQDKSVEELINELKTKTDEFELSAREIEGLLDIIENSLKDEDFDDSKKKVIKEQMYLYLLKKREEILVNADVKEIVETERLGSEYETEDVPFGQVVKAPVFPGCEDAEDQKQCFNKTMQQYVVQNFDISITKGLGLQPGKKKVYIQFKISKEGEVLVVGVRAPHKDLETEGARLVNSLPRIVPGENENGKKVAVTYMLPISFNVE